MTAALSATVVVCTRDRPAKLERCLASLAELDQSGYEVVVVDNSPGSAPVEAVAATHGARYVCEPVQGLSRARNRGASVARGEIVAFIDDDAVAEQAWLRHHAVALARDPRLAATTGRVLVANSDEPGAAAYLAAGGEDLGTEAYRVDRRDPHWFERANFGGLGVGPNMVFRRGLFERGWGFSERLGLGTLLPCEEHYAFFTLIRDGHAVAYLPEARVYHDAPATFQELERRTCRILDGSSAYLVMLVVEEAGHRIDALRFGLRSLAGRRAPWRHEPAVAPLGRRGHRVRAALIGPLLYVRNRRFVRSRASASALRGS